MNTVFPIAIVSATVLALLTFAFIICYSNKEILLLRHTSSNNAMTEYELDLYPHLNAQFVLNCVAFVVRASACMDWRLRTWLLTVCL